jgi:hypothetical protein
MINKYEEMLMGGHPNSLGETLEVVDDVLKSEKNLQDLVDCWKSEDEVVRLRVQNAVKRVAQEKPEWVAKYIPDFLSWISEIDQASTRWGLSTLFMWLDEYLDEAQQKQALKIMKDNLFYDDWIVQNTTAESLTYYAKKDSKLKTWLIPNLRKLQKSRHKSVRKRAEKYLQQLSE